MRLLRPSGAQRPSNEPSPVGGGEFRGGSENGQNVMDLAVNRAAARRCRPHTDPLPLDDCARKISGRPLPSRLHCLRKDRNRRRVAP